MMSGKVVCEVHLLDNSMKTLLVEATTTVQVRWRCGARVAVAQLDAQDVGGRAVGVTDGCSCPCASQDVVRMMAEKMGFGNPDEDSLLFSLHQCQDGVTSECGTQPRCGRALCLRCEPPWARRPLRTLRTLRTLAIDLCDRGGARACASAAQLARVIGRCVVARCASRSDHMRRCPRRLAAVGVDLLDLTWTVFWVRSRPRAVSVVGHRHSDAAVAGAHPSEARVHVSAVHDEP